MEQILRLIEINQYKLPELLFLLVIIAGLTWLAVIVWVLRDVTTRTHNFPVVLLSVALVTFGLLPGLVVYLLIRPQQDLEQQKTYNMFYAGIVDAETNVCPHCSTMIRQDFEYCPNCGENARMLCPECNKRVNPTWHYCIYCQTSLMEDVLLKRLWQRLLRITKWGRKSVVTKTIALRKLVVDLAVWLGRLPRRVLLAIKSVLMLPVKAIRAVKFPSPRLLSAGFTLGRRKPKLKNNKTKDKPVKVKTKAKRVKVKADKLKKSKREKVAKQKSKRTEKRTKKIKQQSKKRSRKAV